eukprot:CAMPEP_0202451982 /NCGR_PEP_ID=MMETSP1360-20130828/10273_1 /ASSEMBLY_ACC=CAM_ASM_000848 /TAXON_ID=515479 /ORGANISM="Licmophora paradoxa, Strain CCMP2313" /LENGTH=292 /DNA_ID=CAMNT_0049070667 /DNA_START=117 /DNA_END=995 /DNA_ORIENTATION=-
MAESPRWLMAKGDTVQAENVLKEIYGRDSDVTIVMREIEDAIEREELAGNMVSWGFLLDPPDSVREMLIVGIIMACAQQVVGVDALQYYAIDLLEEGGISSTVNQLKVLILLGTIKFSFIFVAAYYFDRVGRKTMFYISFSGMAIALTVLAINFWSIDNSVLSVCCLGVYFATFSLGIGPGSWLIPAEIYANCIRAKAMAMSTSFNRLVGSLSASTFLTIADAISWGGYMLVLALISVAFVAFVYLRVPETNGRSLEDMLVYFAEITNDQTILDLESRLSRARPAKPESRLV